MITTSMNEFGQFIKREEAMMAAHVMELSGASVDCDANNQSPPVFSVWARVAGHGGNCVEKLTGIPTPAEAKKIVSALKKEAKAKKQNTMAMTLAENEE